MNFLKRAWYAVIRKPGRTLLLLVVFTAIASFVLTGLAIRRATERAGIIARQKLGGNLVLSFDRQKAMTAARADGMERGQIQSLPVTGEMADLIASQKNVIDYNYIVNAMAMADGFKPVAAQTGNDNGMDAAGNGRASRRPDGTQSMMTIPDVSIVGVLSTKLLDAFGNGGAKLLQGRHITGADKDKHIAVIEKNLAEENGLKIGGTIKLKTLQGEATAPFSIVGIFEAANDASGESFGRFGGMPFTEPYNRIYTDYASAVGMKAAMAGDRLMAPGIDQAVFFVDDPRNIGDVQSDAAKMKIDWEHFKLDANDSAYKRMMGPIENVASFSMTMVYLVAIAGAIILSLLLMLSVKERTYETGVLLSMGEGKLKTVGQYVAEMLLIAFVAFGVSAAGGNIIAKKMGDALVGREVRLAAEEEAAAGFSPGASFGAGGMRGRFGMAQSQSPSSDVKPVTSLDVKITGTEYGRLAVAGVMIIFTATLLPAVNIMRYNPKIILTKAV